VPTPAGTPQFRSPPPSVGSGTGHVAMQPNTAQQQSQQVREIVLHDSYSEWFAQLLQIV